MQIAIRVVSEPKLFQPHHIQYSQGPQGDPFAPPDTPVLPVEAPLSPLQPKAVKRKRRPSPENACSVCGREEKLGTDGPQVMLTCVDCKSKGACRQSFGVGVGTHCNTGHLSCLNLANPEKAVQSNNWQCVVCRPCESCLKKDGDVRLSILVT